MDVLCCVDNFREHRFGTGRTMCVTRKKEVMTQNNKTTMVGKKSECYVLEPNIQVSHSAHDGIFAHCESYTMRLCSSWSVLPLASDPAVAAPSVGTVSKTQLRNTKPCSSASPSLCLGSNFLRQPLRNSGRDNIIFFAADGTTLKKSIIGCGPFASEACGNRLG